MEKKQKLKKLKYIKELRSIMQLQTQRILRDVEEIKAKIISIELALIGIEKPSREDRKAVKLALKEYKNKKTIPFGF